MTGERSSLRMTGERSSLRMTGERSSLRMTGERSSLRMTGERSSLRMPEEKELPQDDRCTAPVIQAVDEYPNMEGFGGGVQRADDSGEELGLYRGEDDLEGLLHVDAGDLPRRIGGGFGAVERLGGVVAIGEVGEVSREREPEGNPCARDRGCRSSAGPLPVRARGGVSRSPAAPACRDRRRCARSAA